MGPRALHIVPHTHWDREWYEPFAVVRYRLVKVVDDVLAALDDPAYPHFMLDGQTAAIEDYLEIRPGAEADVAAVVRAGRLAIGPWRIIPDQFLCSPETLVRNLQQGAATAARLGRRMDIGYLPDPFGHIGQMPQLLRLAGMGDALVWRGVPAVVDRTVFRWEAPDGSWVRAAYTPFGYGHAADLPVEPDALAARVERIIGDLAPFEHGPVTLALSGSDHAGPQTHAPGALAALDGAVPVTVGSLRAWFDEREDATRAPVWRGELRSGARANLLMGVVSARPSLKRLEFRASTALERFAEPLAALTGIAPEGLLDRAWRDVVENSAHDSITGCGIDEVARDVAARYDDAIRLADLIAADALEALAARVDTTVLGEDEEGVLVFAASPRPRGGTATVTLATATPPDRLVFETADGTGVLAQPLEVRRQVALDMDVRGAQLATLVPLVAGRRLSDLFVNDIAVERGRPTTIRLTMGMIPEGDFDVEAAKRTVEGLAARSPRGRFRIVGEGPPLVTMLVDVPSVPGVGWTVLRRRDTGDRGDGVRAGSTWLDNGRVRVEVAADGTLTLDADGVRVTGALAIEDGGDAGDEYNWCPPTRDLIVREPDGEVTVDLVREGPVESTLRIERRYRVPASLNADGTGRARKTVRMPVVTEVSLRAGEDFARATISLENEARDHRVRALVPLPAAVAGSAADGAFEVVERGLDAEGGPHETGTPTFPSRRWVDASDGTAGVAVLHRGSPEYEVVDGRTLAVTLVRAVGFLSRHGMATRAAPAGPVIETPGAQEPGPHRIELALYPHTDDWRTAAVDERAERFCVPLRAVGVRRHEGALPAHAGTLGVQPTSVRLTALTPHQHGVLARVVNAGPEPVNASVTLGPPLPVERVTVVDLLGDEVQEVPVVDAHFERSLRPWEIATFLLR